MKRTDDHDARYYHHHFSDFPALFHDGTTKTPRSTGHKQQQQQQQDNDQVMRTLKSASQKKFCSMVVFLHFLNCTKKNTVMVCCEILSFSSSRC
jgi:hypothetical protein